MHKVVINNVTYDNIGSIEKEIEREYYHQVTSLSGRSYQELRYEKTNYNILIWNNLKDYDALVDFINANKDVAIEVGIPTADGEFEYDKYFLTITNETFKGYLNNGRYYKTGLSIYCRKVNADE